MSVDKSVGDFRDEHALQCERYALSLETIGDDGSSQGLNTHQVTFGDHIMLGQRLTTVGVGLTDATLPRRHALGELVLNGEQQQRAAIITETYDSQTARHALRGGSIRLPDGDRTAPILVIGKGDVNVLKQRGSQLHDWMANILQKVIGDPYYQQFKQ